MNQPLTLTRFDVIGDELALVWGDGGESYLACERLRRACPCAACQGEPDALGRVVRPVPQLGPGGFRLTEVNVVGGYALQLGWGDGHRSGIYSFDLLRRLGEGS